MRCDFQTNDVNLVCSVVKCAHYCSMLTLRNNTRCESNLNIYLYKYKLEMQARQINTISVIVFCRSKHFPSY